MRKTLISLVLITGLLSGSGLVFYLLYMAKPEPRPRDMVATALTVTTQQLTPQRVVTPLAGYGTAQAPRRSDIATEVSGTILTVADNVAAGARVERGQTLVWIDDRDYRQRIEMIESLWAADDAQLKSLDVEQENLNKLLDVARSEMEIARREYDRVRDLLERNQTGRVELDRALQAVEAARRQLVTLENQLALIPANRARIQATREARQAELEMARRNLERCEIKAPFAGQIEAEAVEQGEWVAAGQPLLTLIDTDRVEIPIQLGLSRRFEARAGAAATLALESRPDATWSGRVARIAPVANMASRTFEVFIEVDNKKQETPLTPGSFVLAEVEGPTLTNALLAPRNAIRRGQVFTVEDGVAHAYDVTVTQYIGDSAVVVGPPSGATLITSNLDALFDGARVTPRAETPAPAAAAAQSAGAPTP